MTKFVVSDWLF